TNTRFLHEGVRWMAPRLTNRPRSQNRFLPRFEILESREVPSAAFWEGFAGNAQHTALSSVPSQPLEAVRWQTPVDLAPQYDFFGELLIHYGEVMITSSNTVIIPVKVGAFDGFQIEAHRGTDGSLVWSRATDYILPPADWTPSFPAVLTPTGRLYFAGAG